jgi:taurine transport system permease protein
MSTQTTATETASPARSAMQVFLRKLPARLLPVSAFVLLIIGWYVYWLIAQPRLSTLPPPDRVLRILVTGFADGTLIFHTLASLERLALGTVVGVGSGVILGFAAGLHRRVAEFTMPLAVFFSALSGIVWLPLAIGWLGIGTSLVVFIIWNTVFFLVFSNVTLGVQLVSETLEQGVASLGGGRWRTIRDVTFPGAMPYIMSGVRSGLGFGWRALIAAELIGASTGLGQLIFRAAEFHRTDIILAGSLLIGLIAMIMDRWLLAPLERRTIEKWGLVTSSEHNW